MDFDPTQSETKPGKIQHTEPNFGGDVPLSGDAAEMPIAESSNAAPKTIRAFEKEEKDNSQWRRKTNKTGTGATHVKTFHSKLTNEALIYMDQTINEWLDTNPDFEVKFVSATVGELTGKLKEPHLLCQVWV